MQAVESGCAIVLLGVNIEHLGKGKKPLIVENPDGTVEFRFRTAPASKVFIVDCSLYAESGIVALEQILKVDAP